MSTVKGINSEDYRVEDLLKSGSSVIEENQKRSARLLGTALDDGCRVGVRTGN